MPLRTLAVVAVLAAAGAGLASAQPQAPGGPMDIVRYRQASIDMSVVVRDGMKAAMKDGAEAKSEAYASLALSKWAHVLPTLFPPGSGPGETTSPTQARPEVWTDRAGFMGAAQTFMAATDKLHDLAQANDTQAFKAQLVAVQDACNGCHDRYKRGMMRPPGG